MKKSREIFFGGIVILVSSVLIFGVGELYFRFFNPQLPAFLRPDPVVGTMHFSDYTVRQNSACMKVTTHFNHEGMNDIDHKIEKLEGVYRIAVIGDSYVEAMQFPLEQSFFKVMEKNLQKKGYQVEVLAFGVGGFGTLQEYYLLRDYALKYKPDLVILSFFTYNDIRNNSSDLEKSLDMPYAELDSDGNVEFPEFKLRDEYVQTFNSPLRTLIFEHSDLVRFVYRLSNQSIAFRNFLAYFHLQTPAIQSPDQKKDISNELYLTDMTETWRNAWDVTEALIQKIKETSESNGAKFLLFSLSNDVQLSKENFRSVKKQYPGQSLNPELPEQMLGAFSRRNSIWYLSALPAMKELTRNGVVVHPSCHGHWSPKASRRAADLLASSIEREFLVQ